MYKHLISEQRYAIYLMLQEDMSQKDIAAAIIRHSPSLSASLYSWIVQSSARMKGR